jgi:hypothetical protein
MNPLHGIALFMVCIGAVLRAVFLNFLFESDVDFVVQFLVQKDD